MSLVANPLAGGQRALNHPESLARMRIFLFSLVITLLLLLGHSSSGRGNGFTPQRLPHTIASPPLHNDILSATALNHDHCQLSAQPRGLAQLLARPRSPATPPLPRGATIALAGAVGAFLLFSGCYRQGALPRGTTRRALIPLHIPLRL
jgi:hypothetical protein